jgi:serine/threonine protein kinase
MNRDAALASLGLSGNEDTATIARVYGERLSAVQEKLISAQTDADRNACRTTLSELVEAYEFVTATGRYTKPPAANNDAATVMRSGTEVVTPSAPSSDTLVRFEPGAVLSSRLEIGDLLGSGGMGNVYAARDRLKNEDVAIKVLRQDLQFSSAAKDRFLAEAKVSCNLSHPNIVRVHDVGVSGGYYYFSMERLKGHTLRQRIDAYHSENREFPIMEVTDIARQLIDALRYAHRYIVHRDLKPENIWLADDGTVKLMDFGIARAYTSAQLTQTGITLGTAYYMAPEQRVAAKDVDWRADQYSLGVVLYELLAGTLPVGAVKPLENIRRDLPKRYARAMMRAMSPKPDDRFQSLNDLLAEMVVPERKVAGGLGRWVLIGAGVAAAAAGAAIVLINRDAAAPPAETPPVEQKADATTPPPVDPPPTEEPTQVAADPVIESKAGPVETEETKPAAVADVSTEKPAPPPPERRVAAVNNAAAIDSRRQECMTQCERDDAECRSINRRGKQDCMRAVAFGGTGRLRQTDPAAASCAFYGQDRCDRARNRDACLSRIALRHQACVDVFGGNIASRRQDCEENARESDRLCLDQMRDCRTTCE